MQSVLHVPSHLLTQFNTSRGVIRLFHAQFRPTLVSGHDKCMPRDCLEVRDMGFNTSGVYPITPMGVYKGFDVYCDMETDNGGWLVSSLTDNGGWLVSSLK